MLQNYKRNKVNELILEGFGIIKDSNPLQVSLSKTSFCSMIAWAINNQNIEIGGFLVVTNGTIDYVLKGNSGDDAKVTLSFGKYALRSIKDNVNLNGTWHFHPNTSAFWSNIDLFGDIFDIEDLEADETVKKTPDELPNFDFNILQTSGFGGHISVIIQAYDIKEFGEFYFVVYSLKDFEFKIRKYYWDIRICKNIFYQDGHLTICGAKLSSDSSKIYQLAQLQTNPKYY